MKAIHIKLFRDLWNMRGAVITIALVMACGVSAFVTLRGTYQSIVNARDRYYSSERFGDVFAQLERAPTSLVQKIENIPGVARIYARVSGPARTRLPGLGEPAQTQIVSLPEGELPTLNGLKLVTGRLPSEDRDDEAVLIESFAERHGVALGRELDIVVEGRERKVRIVGTGMSPEFVMAVPNGAQAPAPERFAVLWMVRPAVEAAFDMRGAFNNVVLDIAPDANEDSVLRELDLMLDRYGGRGAYPRKRQTSHYFLTQDMASLDTMATIAPAIFLGVAVFLLNVVLSRLIELDRPQIATLKAVGYSNWEVGLLYLGLALIIVLCGGAIGLSLGAWFGDAWTAMYTTFYRLPSLVFRLDADLAMTSVLVSLGSGIVGSMMSVRRVMRLSPAEAMRPAPPPAYRRSTLGSIFAGVLTPSARIVAREIMRRPARTALSAVGIGAATGLLVVGMFFSDSMSFLLDYYMQTQQREVLAAQFVNPVPEASVHALAEIRGVRDVQFQLSTQVRVRNGHRERVVSLIGHAPRHSMRPLLDSQGDEVPLRSGDVLFTDMLAKVLELEKGQRVIIEPMLGDRTPRTLTVTGTLSELMGMWIHAPLDEVHHLLGQTPQVSEATLIVDKDEIDAVKDELSDMPQVATVTRKELTIAEFRKQTGESLGMFSFIMTLFAVTISISVVYNNARVALSMRGRELASLRVLGFTRGEISTILVSELAVQVLFGIPLGLLIGKGFVALMLAANDPEAFRFPSSITGHTLAFSALVTGLGAVASALLVRRKLDKLDLIEVLKTRE